MSIERAYFPMDVITLTQGYGDKSSTHQLGYQLDLSGKDGGKDKVYAPFDCKIVKLYQPKDTTKHATTVWIKSINKVMCPNGYYGHLIMSITHPSEILKMRLGCTYKQGEVMCYEGTTGNASGNHIHLELSTSLIAGWSKKISKVNGTTHTEYVINGAVKPEEYLFVKESSTIKKNVYKNKEYKFIKESTRVKEIYNVKNPPLNIHNKPDVKKNSIIKNIGLKNGHKITYLCIEQGMYKICYNNTIGYITKGYMK